MATAVARSMECGANGSVWLESLPRATAFYENLGMAKQRGRSGEGHYIYVLAPKPARQFLEQTKEKRILEI
jgi:hypothetical protein